MRKSVGGPFPWTGDVDRGAWLRERLASGSSALESGRAEPVLAEYVPSGYAAIVRILHPFTRDRVRGMLVERGVRWEMAARAFGYLDEIAPDTRAPDVVGRDRRELPDNQSLDGWRYSLPEEGSLDSDVLALAAAVLAAHTSTPDDGIAAVWAGYGGLMSSSSSSVLTSGGPGDSAEPGSWGGPITSVDDVDLEALTHELLFQPQAEPGTGILSREAATGPQLVLPGREYVCFEAGISAFTQESWPARAPWIEDPKTSLPQSPNLIWPEGREWFLISEIDFDSTLVACSLTCAEALEAHPGIEAIRITRDTSVF